MGRTICQSPSGDGGQETGDQESQESGIRNQETAGAVPTPETSVTDPPPISDTAEPYRRLARQGRRGPAADITFKQVDIIEMPAEPPLEEIPSPMRNADFDRLLTPAPVPDSRPADSCDRRPRRGRRLPFPAPMVPAEPSADAMKPTALGYDALAEMWEQEARAARRKLEPEGALTGATRELQAGLGASLSICHEHGVKVGPWRLQHVVPEWTFGDHPTYGAVTIAHWACKDGQPWKVGLGLFLARGAGKPKDLEVKLAVMDAQPAVVDHLILLRPEDDLTVTGKSKTLWQEAERRGRHARLEPVSLDGFAQLYAFPRWLAAVRESLPEGSPLPNLADVIQEKCEKLLEQVCMPVQG